MPSKPNIISWVNFTGGINDNKYQAPSGRYFRGYNVDTQRFDVQPSVLNEIVHTFPANIGGIFHNFIVGGSSNIVWLEDGRIYENNTSNLRATIAGSGKFGRAIGYMKIGTQYKLYYFHEAIPSQTKYIHRSNISGTGFEENYKTYVSDEGNPGYAPIKFVKSEGWRILFSDYNKLFQIDTLENIIELIEFPPNENIVGISEFVGSYKIYTTTGLGDSKMYDWNGFDNLPASKVDLKGIAITSVIQDGDTDYAIADGHLYQFQGVRFSKMHNNLGGRILAKIEDEVYLEFAQDGKQTLGVIEQNPGYPRSLTPKYSISHTSTTAEIGSGYKMTFDANTIYYATGTQLRRIGGASPLFTFESSIESLVFVGESIQDEKDIREIHILFSNTSANCEIKLQCQIQENGTWIDLWQGYNAEITRTNHGIKLAPTNLLNPIGKFNTIRFRVVFISNGQTTCKFYGIHCILNDKIGA